MVDYIEKEVKVLDVNVEEVRSKLVEIGAKEVFDAIRKLITFDDKEGTYRSQNKVIRLTDEGTYKVSINSTNEDGKIEAIKFKTSGKQETIDFLSHLKVAPVAQVEAQRISYELDGIDFDIDQFPDIPAFMEIDAENINDILDELLEKLNLKTNKIFALGTEKIFESYGKDYYDLYRIQ